MASGADKGQI
ncbi:hypothetical protein F383_20279 [Gossypium arboreum]|uniref:Uncharacterized protein n=1 Tax=Gossypium arboreum TaxID=29729 RepID=A0A0B0NQJ4_GOSAR|nr:hypothetical protein F383_20279 [Gossypium arboreum]